MNLKHLTDSQLVFDLQVLVKNERELLLLILYHLKEIEARKLYSDYNCTSLFDYACKELKYSADQAYRRIQAMRLLKEIPETAGKINSGELSLTNINQAQRFFNENKVVTKAEKIVVLKKLINKSTRDGHKELLKLSPLKPLPDEIKKQVTQTHTYVSFNMSEQLEKKLIDLKTLLGPKAYGLNMSELIEMMADLSLEKLKENKFGKKRVKKLDAGSQEESIKSKQLSKNFKEDQDFHTTNQSSAMLSTIDKETKSTLIAQSTDVLKSKHKYKSQIYKNPRYISANLKYNIWHKDHGQCTKCNSVHNLQIDHIKPLAFGGSNESENLRLLCFHCNQRQRIKAGLFG